MTFGEYLAERVGKSWALCRATKTNRDRYGACLSRSRYCELGRDYVRDNPESAMHNWPALPNEVTRELDRAAELGIARARMDAARSLYGPPGGGKPD